MDSIWITADDVALIEGTNYTVDPEAGSIKLLPSCWKKQIYGKDSGLLISDRNYIKQFEEKVDHSNLVTKLYIYGQDGLSIRNVNPTGQDYIMDFSPYRVYKDTDGNGNSEYLS